MSGKRNASRAAVVGAYLLLGMGLLAFGPGCGGETDDPAGEGGSALGGSGGAGDGGTGDGGSGGSPRTDPLCPDFGGGAEPVIDWAGFAHPLMQRECLSCHSSSLTGARRNKAPVGMNYDTEDDLRKHEAKVMSQIRAGKMPRNRPRLENCIVEALELFFDN